MVASAGKKLLGSIVDSENSVEEFVEMQLDKSLFVGVEEDVFEYMNHHVSKYGVMPSRETINNETEIELPKTKEPPNYYYDHVQNRYVQREMKQVFLDGQDLLNQKKPQEALILAAEKIATLTLHKHKKQLMDFTQSGLELITSEYKKKVTLGDEYGIPVGWPYLDSKINGLMGGDVVIVVGRPASGKTYNLLHMAHYGWWNFKKRPLVVSMEMKPLPLAQRLTAMHSSVGISQLKKGELSSKLYQKMRKGLQKINAFDVPFWIVDGNLTATVQDIILLARQLKPDAVYIDGAYLIRHTNTKVNRTERTTEVIQMIKSELAQELDIPVVASYQFNRDSIKNKKDGAAEMGLEHIALSDAIGQIATVVLGILEEENIESMMSKQINVLKGRNGESGNFRINWRFDTVSESGKFMDFSEYKEPKLEDLQFL